MKFLFKNKKGFTLVELLVAMAILVVVMTAVYLFFNSARKYNSAIEASNQRQQLQNEVMYRLRVELSDAAEAEAFDPVTAPEKIDLTRPENSDYYYIVFNSADEDGNGAVDGGFLYYGFDSAGNRAAPVKYGVAMSAKRDFYCKVTFVTETSGASNIETQVINVGDATETSIDTISSKIKLRSVATNGVGTAIRFKKIS